MIKFLLDQLEKAPNPVFSKRELLAISPDDFADLKRRKILSYCRPPEGFSVLAIEDVVSDPNHGL